MDLHKKIQKCGSRICRTCPYLEETNFFHSSTNGNSRKSVRWSAVPVAPVLVCVRCEGERGSGPKGADDLCSVSLEA